MTRPDDEIFMGFADNTLSAEERKRVETYLDANPQDRALVETFRRASDLARNAVESADLPPRRELVDFVRGSTARASSAAETDDDASAVIPFLKFRKQRMSVSRHALPLAAAMALIVGFTGGYLLGFNRVSTNMLAMGPLDQRSTLVAALDRSPSGAPSSIDRSLQVVATFRDVMDRPCREFERLDQRSRVPVEAGIACKVDGGWVIEGAARVAAAPVRPGFKPSGTQERDPLASMMERLGAGAVLSPADEQKLLESGWK